MTQPQIVWRGLNASAALEARIGDEVALLDTLHDRITSCRVVVEVPSESRQHARHFQVRIEVSVPGRQLNVANDGPRHKRTEDPYIAVAEAFSTLREELQGPPAAQSEPVKRHGKQHSGVVSKLQEGQPFGFISADEGGELYFHESSVLDDAWRRLVVGDRVRFHPDQGDQGPQAKSVQML